MPQVPTSARKKYARNYIDPDSDEGVDSEIESHKKKQQQRLPRVSLTKKLLEKTPSFPLGFIPRSDDEKHEVYLCIIRLRSLGKNYAEIATALGLSEKTIRTYKDEPMYVELETLIEVEAKQQGYHLIGEMILDSYETLFELMKYSNSDFVRYKCAAEILMHAGYGIPREEAKSNSRDEALKFLDEVARRSGQQHESGHQPVQVNVQINNVGGETTMPSNIVVEATSGPDTEEVDSLPEQAQSRSYFEPVLPGGKIPESFKTMKQG